MNRHLQEHFFCLNEGVSEDGGTSATHLFDYSTKESEDIQLWEIPAKKAKKDNHAYPKISFQLEEFFHSVTRHVRSRDGASLKGKQPGRVWGQVSLNLVGFGNKRETKTVWPQFGHFDDLYLCQDCCQFHCRRPVCHGHGEAYGHWHWNLLLHPSQQPIFTQVATACVELAHHRMFGSLSLRSQLHSSCLAAPFIRLGH